MLKQLLIIGIAGASATALSALAIDAAQVQKATPLKDGSVVYTFDNGKMGMVDKFGRPISMEPGVPMETKDGKALVMVGNETARVYVLERKDNQR